MAFLAILAYPRPDQEHKIDVAIHAMKAWQTKRAARCGYDRAKLSPELLAVQPRAIGAQLRRIHSRIAKRLRAKNLAVAKCLTAPDVASLWGALIGMPGAHVDPANGNDFMRLYTESKDSDALGYMRRDIWDESRPVLHLVWALERGIESAWPENRPVNSLLHLLADWSWIAPAVKAAEEYRAMCALIPVLNIHADNQIRVLPIPATGTTPEMQV